MESNLTPPSGGDPAVVGPSAHLPGRGVPLLSPRAQRLWLEIVAALKRDQAFVMVAVSYFLLSVVVGPFIGWRGPIALGLSYAQVAMTTVAVVVIALVHERVRSDRELPPLTGYHRAWARLRTGLFSSSRLSSYGLVCLLMPAVISCFTGWKVWLNAHLAFSWDDSFTAIDRILHGDHLPWIVLRPLLDVHWIVQPIAALYALGWFVAVQAVSVWQAFAAPSRRRSQFLTASALAWPLAGNLLAGAFMSAGPWFDARVHGLSPYAAAASELSRVEHHTLWAQDYLYAGYIGYRLSAGSGISAMPSMHLVMATIIACVLFGYGRVARGAGLVFLLCILIGSVLLGWHYAVDSYAGILLGCLIWIIAGSLVGTHAERPGPSRASAPGGLPTP